MINEPVVDRLVEKLGTPEHPASRYKEIALACQEIVSGKLTMTKD